MSLLKDMTFTIALKGLLEKNILLISGTCLWLLSSISAMFGQRRPCLLVLYIHLLNGVFGPTLALARSQPYYDFGYIFNFTKHLYMRNEFDCFVTFVADRTPKKPLGDQLYVRSLHRAMVEDLNLPAVTWGLKSNISLSGILTSRTLVLATITSLQPELEPMLEVLHKTLNRCHHLRIIFIMECGANATPSVEELKEFFAWCWRHNFINVALTFQRITFTSNRSHNVHNELFSYTPFPKLRLLNVTNLGISYNWPTLDVRNVQGYEFRVPVYQEVFNAFLLPDGQLSGSFGLLTASYIRYTKGRLRLEPTPHVNAYNYHASTLLAATRGEIDIGVHLYTHMTLNSELVEGASTLRHTQTCIIVPRQKEVPLHRFSRYALRSNLLLLVFLVLSLTGGWQLVARNGFKGLYFALVIFHVQPLEDMVFRRLPSAYRILHVSFLLNAYLLWNVRTAYLSASFSTKLSEPQISNLKDFMQSPLRIMLTETEVKMYFTPGLLPAALQPRLLVVNASTLLDHLSSLNTSYAYCSNSNHWQILQLQQKRLRHSLFRRVHPDLCTPVYVSQIPMQPNSPFRQNFLRFYINTQRYGFFQKWERLSSMQAVNEGLIKIIHEDVTYASLQLKDFEVLVKAYVFLIGISLLCLLCEIVWKHGCHIICSRG